MAIANILNVLFLLSFFGIIYLLFYLPDWIFRKLNSSIPPAFNLIYSFLFVPITFFVFGTYIKIYSKISSIFAPDYVIGWRIYSVWGWIGLFFIPVVFYLISSFRKKTDDTAKRKINLIELAILVIGLASFLVIGVVIYQTVKGPGSLENMFYTMPYGSARIPDNIVEADSMKITLYPRNGTWTKEGDYFFSLPRSDGGYELGINRYEASPSAISGVSYYKSLRDNQLYQDPLKGFQIIGDIKIGTLKGILLKDDSHRLYFFKSSLNRNSQILVFDFTTTSSVPTEKEVEVNFRKILGSIEFNEKP